MPRGARIGYIAQEAPAGAATPFETVLAADVERAALLARGEATARPRPSRRDPRAAERDRRLCGAGARGAHPGRARLRRGGAAPAARQLLGRLADARGARRAAVLGARPAAARRAVEPSRSRGGAVARGLPQELSRDDPGRQPRARLPQQCRRPHPPSRARQADPLSGRLRRVRAAARRAPGAARLGAREAAGASARSCRTISPATRARALDRQAGAVARPRRWRGCSRSPSWSTIRRCRSASPTRSSCGRRWSRSTWPSVGYGETPVLSRLNLRLDPDDRIALLGRNGNGKTTLARLLAAQLAADGGRDDRSRQAEGRLFHPVSGRGARRRRHARSSTWRG